MIAINIGIPAQFGADPSVHRVVGSRGQVEGFGQRLELHFPGNR